MKIIDKAKTAALKQVIEHYKESGRKAKKRREAIAIILSALTSFVTATVVTKLVIHLSAR